MITTIQREVPSTFDSSRKLKPALTNLEKCFCIRKIKVNGNKWRAMHLRRKTQAHKYKMETYSLCSTMGETYTGVTEGHPLSTSHQDNGAI